MSSTVDETNSTDPTFASARTKYAMLRHLLDTSPGGSSVHLPPMTDKPDPDRDQLVIRILGFWNDLFESNPAQQENHWKARIEYGKKSGQLDKELGDIKVELTGGNGQTVGEVLQRAARYTVLLEKKNELSQEEGRIDQQKNKEAVEALKEETQKW